MFVFSRRKRVSLSGCYGVQMLRGNGIGRDKQWTFMIDFERWSRSFEGRKWLVRRDPRRSKGLCRINSRSFRLLRPSHWSQNVIEGRRGVSYVIRGQRTRWLYSATCPKLSRQGRFWQLTLIQIKTSSIKVLQIPQSHSSCQCSTAHYQVLRVSHNAMYHATEIVFRYKHILHLNILINQHQTNKKGFIFVKIK